MKTEKIIEIARRFANEKRRLQPVELNDGQVIDAAIYHTYWEFREETLIAFAQAIIEAERDAHGITVPLVVWDKLKDVNSVADLIKALKAAEEE